MIRGPGLLTQCVHTHALCSSSLLLEKVIIKPAQVIPASLERKTDIEIGAVGSQNDAVLGRRKRPQREDSAHTHTQLQGQGSRRGVVSWLL